mgnify:CR=1 FL=1|tara:strand:+ start:1697 stop:2269 length:573 start_codon:yes stop_codon:yes gene_type:complete
MIEKIIEFDKKLFLFLNKGNSLLDDFFVFITNDKIMALFIIPTVFSLAVIFQKHKIKHLVGCVFLTFILTDFIHYYGFKEYFQRLRPCWDPEISEICRVLVDKGGKYGFVSGHASSTVGIVSMLFFSIPNLKIWIKYILISWALLICYSRVYVGKHFPLDVFFGALLGFCIAFFVYKLFFPSNPINNYRK